MVYRELNRGNYPELVQFERIKSGSSDEFDLVVDEILNKKMGPMATQVGRIPHPLVFNFLDRDRFGASNILVNIFDYSGEVIRSQTIEDRQRQRALDGDGFFFFLDPTEPSETQSQALAGFREDLRRIKGLKAGRQIHIPVALCVSKIDLMVDEPYADPDGGGVIDHFYRDLGQVGWDMSQRSIAARSRLTARAARYRLARLADRTADRRPVRRPVYVFSAHAGRTGRSGRARSEPRHDRAGRPARSAIVAAAHERVSGTEIGRRDALR